MFCLFYPHTRRNKGNAPDLCHTLREVKQPIPCWLEGQAISTGNYDPNEQQSNTYGGQDIRSRTRGGFDKNKDEAKRFKTFQDDAYGGGGATGSGAAGNTNVSMSSGTNPRNSKEADVSMLTSDLTSWGLDSEQPWQGGDDWGGGQGEGEGEWDQWGDGGQMNNTGWN